MKTHGDSRPPRPVHATTLVAILAVLVSAAAVGAQSTGIDTVPGPFDYGRMWTYEYPPSQYFTETYGFEADAEWFDRVRLSVLRVPGCSASFVSPNGLVATNHHCVRGRIPSIERPGESLLDDGFYATSLDEERRIPGYHADRLIAVEDVTAEILAAIDRAEGDEARREARARAAAEVQARLAAQHGDRAVYDRHHSYGSDAEWALPARWLPPPEGLDLETPLNFISTADTYGGNSGSPAITPRHEMVGLNFDRNIEGLSEAVRP